MIAWPRREAPDMPTERRRGMDHSIYPYSAIPERAPFRLPGDKPVALYIVLQIEHWELLQPAGAYRDPRHRGEFRSYDPDYRAWSYRAYGNRVGLYRVLEMLDRMNVPVTAAVGAGVIEANPEIVRELAKRRYEIVAHGLTTNRMITSRMSEDEERSHIATSRAAIRQAFGADPAGWLGQDYGLTPRTSWLLAEAGFAYTLDWANDEQPYVQEGPAQLIAMPAPSELDDVQTLSLRKVAADRFPGLVADALDELARSGRQTARATAIGVHPFMLGAPHRSRYLRQTLEAVLARSDVHLTTAGDLASLYRRQLA
jgi:allantoinase